MAQYDFSSAELVKYASEHNVEKYETGTGVGMMNSVKWDDSLIDTIPIHRIKHQDPDVNDAIFIEWLKETRSSLKDIESFIALTVYVGMQILDPESGDYIIPETDVAAAKKLTGINSEISELFEGKLREFGRSNIDPRPPADAAGYGTKDIRRKMVPAYALYSLRVVYRTSFNLKDPNKLLALKAQIGSFYGIAQSETITIDFPIEFQSEMSQRSYIGTQIINTALVSCLKAASKPDTSEYSKAILNYCFLLHSKWNGFAAISRLMVICKSENRQPQFFIDSARFAVTDSMLDSLENFFDRHLRKDHCSHYAPWCRAIANNYEMELSNSNMLIVIAIWTYIIDPCKETPIWTSHILDKLPATHDKTALKIAHMILAFIRHLQLGVSEKNKLLGNMLRNNKMTDEAIMLDMQQMARSKSQPQPQIGLMMPAGFFASGGASTVIGT
ncbi:hypothetical protein 1 [Hubei rhabdo-like virus 9]|uniref:Nucleoprotein n=1 Tax=Hubei rhabdo-like virus 9 TaxID=1923193 RepID=A0A1L3KN24_9RHAB|nr:hypothetical protein 1 [Hubei rhabdo-like virus 9]APG78811.1 hypothetical protein 1 [Hubei rhabdo-like virus 9]